MKNSLLLMGLVGLLASFSPDDPAYMASIEGWHRQRVQSLKSEDGWLNLAGLYWLKPGENTFGSDSSNDLVFLAKAPQKLGSLILENGTVSVRLLPNAGVTAQGEPITEGVIFDDERKLHPSLAWERLRWTIIKRGDRYALRLRDLDAELVRDFLGIERYSVDERWRIEATAEVPFPPQTATITDVVGTVSQQNIAAYLVFRIGEQTYKLAATDAGRQYFVVFADATNGHETYGSGRFLYVEKSSPNSNKVWLDFNKATNPPCAFTAYATCPLPPKQNFLPVGIPAGEKNFGHH
jgi:uncharacterized protein